MSLPDSATIALALAAPAVAGAVALWINERRMRHDKHLHDDRLVQERWLRRRDELRDLLQEGADLLATALTPRPIEDDEADVRARMVPYYNRLRLRVDGQNPLAMHWLATSDAYADLGRCKRELHARGVISSEDTALKVARDRLIRTGSLWIDSARLVLD